MSQFEVLGDTDQAEIKMSKPSTREFQQHRKIKDLQEQNDKLKNEVLKLRQQLEKQHEKKELPSPAKIKSKACPDCGAEIKETEMPHGVMELCSAACGFRRVRKK